MVYVGMDVHRKRTQVAILEQDGTVVSNRRLGNFDGTLQETLHRLDPGTPVVMEAAFGWGWLADLAQELRLELHLAHPRNCKAIAAARLEAFIGGVSSVEEEEVQLQDEHEGE